MDIILSKIRCIECDNILEEPVFLPCGKSICKKHVVMASRLDKKILNCRSCHLEHHIPEAGFCINHDLQDLLATKFYEIDLGDEYKRAVSSCKKLDVKLDLVDFLRETPSVYITNTLNQLRNEVESVREEFHAKVHETADRLIDELNNYEIRCLSKVDLKDYSQVESQVRQDVADIHLKLNNLGLVANDSKKIVNNCEKINTQLDLIIAEVQNGLMEKKMKEYQLKIMEFNEMKISITPRLDSGILDMQMKVDLFELLGYTVAERFKLLYKASVDGFEAEKFHKYCDNLPNTLTIIKTSNGCIFGGFTTAMWDKSKQYKVDENAFIFSLCNKDNRPVKMKISPEREHTAIYCSCGPTFGSGQDLYIADCANANTNSFSNLGYSYKHPKYEYQSEDAKRFLAGKHNFQVEEIEVFQKL